MSISNNTIEGGRAPPGDEQEDMAKKITRTRAPSHPGEVIASTLETLGLNNNQAAIAMHVSRQAFHKVMNGAAVTPDMALRLGKFFGNGPEIWLGLQADYDLYRIEREIRDDLAKIKKAKEQ